MMSLDSPIIYSQPEDRGHLPDAIDEIERLSIGPEPDTPTEVHLSEPGNVVEDTSDVKNGPPQGALGFDSSVKRMELSQTGAGVSDEKYAAALETIKRQQELIEKLSKGKEITEESLGKNQQSVETVAESGQRSPKEDDVKDDDDASKEELIVDMIPAIHSNERMNKNHRCKIQKHMNSLWLNIEPRELVIQLHSLFVFDEDEFEYLLDHVKEKGRSSGSLEMLRKLYRKGPNSYILFLLALERCKHTWVIQTLEPDCVIYQGRIKYSGQKFYELIDNTSAKYREFVERCEKNIGNVYDDHPGQQFVVVKKLAKGCVEVTFHLVSLGYNNGEDLRRPLQDLVKSGFINKDPVKPDEFYFRQITDEELASERESMTQRRIIVLEKEIETLKLKTNELLVENLALKATSANCQEMEKYKEKLATKYTDTLQDKELIISSLQEQLNQQATGTNVDMADRTDYNRLDQDKEPDLTVLLIDDNKDKGKEEKGKDAERLDKDKHLTLLTKDDGHDDDRVIYLECLSANAQRKIAHIIDYLVTRHHPVKLKLLVQLLVDKGVIDNDESKQITKYIDRDDIEAAGQILLTRLAYTSRPDSYLHLIRCLKELGLSYIVDGFDEDLSVIDQIKIRKIMNYLVTRHPDKLKPLVKLLKDKGVIDDDGSKQITMDIDIDDIKVAGLRLSLIINSSPNSYLHLIGCLEELGLSYIEGMIDSEYPDWYRVESSKPLGTKKTDLMGFEENKKHLKEREKKKSMEFSSAHTSQSRSSPD